MGDTWGLMTTLTPLALVVAASPFSILPVMLLVLHSARPKATGLAFLLGWLAGKAALTVLFVVLPHLVAELDGPAPTWTAWVQVGLGVLLIGAGGWRWATRDAGASDHTPRWLTTLGKITPLGAAAVGLAFTVVNVKILVACAAAGLAIGTADLSLGSEAAAVAYFTAVAGSTATIPLLAYLVAADRLEDILERARRWIECREPVLTTVVLVVVGILLVLSGIRAL